MSDNLNACLSAAQAVLADTTTGPGLPNACYTDDAMHAYQDEALFATTWAAVGFGKDVPEVGDVFPVDFLGQPLFLTRDKTGTVRVYHNICSHRGMILVSEPGHTKGLVRCPYHSWCYDLEGALKRTPYVGGSNKDDHADFEPAKHGLREVRSHLQFDVVFVNLSGDAPTFEDVHAPLLGRWHEFADRPLYHGGTHSTLHFELNGNWKLAIENFCEAYHLPWIHPGLNSYSRIEDHYHIEEPGHFSGQGTTVYNPDLMPGTDRKFPSLDDISDKWDTGAEYIALYPNVLLGVHRDHFYAILISADGPHKTRERAEFYYYDEACTGASYEDLREVNVETWREVFLEDVFVVEGMHKGRSSSGFTGGVLTPVQDPPTRLFHQWAAGRMLKHHNSTSLAAE